MEKKKKIFAVGPTTFVTFRNNNNNTNTSSNQSTEKICLTKVTFLLFIKEKLGDFFLDNYEHICPS
jgi:hypothetical protein